MYNKEKVFETGTSASKKQAFISNANISLRLLQGIIVIAVLVVIGLIAGTVLYNTTVNEETRNETFMEFLTGSDFFGMRMGSREYDRAGNPITLPQYVNTVVSIGAAATEILAELGFGSTVIGGCPESRYIPGIEFSFVIDPAGIDSDLIIYHRPDIVFAATGIIDGYADPLESVREAGIALLYIPPSVSVRGIMEDIRFIATAMGSWYKGDTLARNLEADIRLTAELLVNPSEFEMNVFDIAEWRETQPNIYFETSPAPYLASFGTGVFLNEMITRLNAVNIFGFFGVYRYEGHVSVTEEQVFAADPDIIFTNSAGPDPIAEIKSRPGWENLTAVQNGRVYHIDPVASTRPSHNILAALDQMIDAIFPDWETVGFFEGFRALNEEGE